MQKNLFSKNITHKPVSLGLWIAAVILSLSPGICWADTDSPQSPVAQTRSIVKEWVQAEQVLSAEQAQWHQERALIKDMITVLDKETESLREIIKDNEASLTQADEQRASLLETRSSLHEKRKLITQFLENTEPVIHALETRLPTPLQQQLAPFFIKLPQDSKTTDLGIAERMQVALAILDAIRAFDRKMTVAHELHSDEQGSPYEVTTLYIGLGQAFYISAQDAGIGTPTQTGWKWESQPKLHSSIQKAITMIEGNTHDIGFITLPLTVSNQAEQ